MSMQKEKLFNEANKKNSKLDAKPILSQQKRYHNNTFDIVLLFLNEFGQVFPCLAK